MNERNTNARFTVKPLEKQNGHRPEHQQTATPSRSENTLLWELVQRDPERAKVFLERLGYAVRK